MNKHIEQELRNAIAKQLAWRISSGIVQDYIQRFAKIREELEVLKEAESHLLSNAATAVLEESNSK